MFRALLVVGLLLGGSVVWAQPRQMTCEEYFMRRITHLEKRGYGGQVLWYEQCTVDKLHFEPPWELKTGGQYPEIWRDGKKLIELRRDKAIWYDTGPVRGHPDVVVRPGG